MQQEQVSRRKLAGLIAVVVLGLAGCGEPRESTSVEVTPPPVVEIPVQTKFHQAVKGALPETAVVSAGQPAIEALNASTAHIAQYAPEPASCAGTVESDLYTTRDVVMGFHATDDGEHSAQTVVAADFGSADAAADYFAARTQAWRQCESVDLTIDDTNVLTLHYAATGLTESDLSELPETLVAADQDLVLTSSGELSGALQAPDVPLPNPGALPDYVISPDDVPEPEAENISVTSSAVVVRYDSTVYWIASEPGDTLETAAQTLANVVEAVQDPA